MNILTDSDHVVLACSFNHIPIKMDRIIESPNSRVLKNVSFLFGDIRGHECYPEVGIDQEVVTDRWMKMVIDRAMFDACRIKPVVSAKSSWKHILELALRILEIRPNVRYDRQIYFQTVGRVS